MSDEKQPDPPKRPAPPRPGAARPPVPPPAGLLHREETPLMEYMRSRMELMERELYQARERAQASENALKQQEALRGEVEIQLKKISEQIQHEKLIQRLEEDKSASRGRVDSLEKRLDEMHATWSDLLKEAIGKREAEVSLSGAEAQVIADGLAELRGELARLKEGVSQLPGMLPEIQRLREMIPAESERRTQEEKTVREHLRGMLDRMAENVMERLSEMDRKLAEERDVEQERLAALTRERESLRQAMDELRHNVRQETLKEKLQLESRFNERVEELKGSIKDVLKQQTGTEGSLGEIRELTGKLHEILSRPAKAKDQIILDIESEKRELMDALKDRTEKLRAFTLERREVERSLGESLMDLNRRLEEERAKDRQRLEQIASLENTIDGLKAETRLDAEKAAQREEYQRGLAQERDKLVEALALEAEKVRTQIDLRMDSDKKWESKLLEFQKLLNDEKERRLQAEQANSDLRAQIQTLSDHIARVLREKERTEQEFSQWNAKKAELLETLQKKDEMIGMLSSTFKNILKKPDA